MYAFEVSPRNLPRLRANLTGVKGVTIVPGGAWDRNGTMDLNLDTRGPSTASTLVRDIGTRYASGKMVTVPVYDLSDFLVRRFRPEDTVVVKMDIEGAEYSVLRRVFLSGAIRLVDALYIEWHWRWTERQSCFNLHHCVGHAHRDFAGGLKRGGVDEPLYRHILSTLLMQLPDLDTPMDTHPCNAPGKYKCMTHVFVTLIKSLNISYTEWT
eukprot:TRINITY_DN2162_c0_g1_i2.p2 TRINITY_DN2162_c0_g1~~TRINITY_DN2162_c0_g1_i2.p2  ORF type:complete len:211 (+),score=37.14 TRINITY_DN2162_c0_g1_i2:344-976(+)